MEADRYQKNHTLFIIGIFSLVIGLSLLAFSLYLLPHLLFGWRYNAPEFIMFWREWLQSQYGYMEPAASKLIFLFFFGLAAIFGFIAYFTSNRLESEIFSTELEEIKAREPVKSTPVMTQEGLSLSLKIILIIIAVFIVSALIEWIIYT
jgi:hypothetical protein